MLVKDNFYITFKNNYNKIKIILGLYRVIVTEQEFLI